MNHIFDMHCGGKLSLKVIRKGKVINEMNDIPNLVTNAGLAGSPLTAAYSASTHNFMTYTSATEPWEDVNGTWNQSGNTVTRATGTGVFTATRIGDEIKWNTGERSHITARASDTSITVSGPARTITGGSIRRYDTGSGSSARAGFIQQQNSATGVPTVTWGTGEVQYSKTWQANFASATSAYTLRSFAIGSGLMALIVLPAPVDIEIDDQIQCTYTYQNTVSNLNAVYELGSESTGIPTKFSMTTIVGNGSYVDVTFSAATHFLAGDKLDLRGVIPKRFAISSASSTSTTLTINTTAAHGLSVSDTVVISGASLAGYNGTFTVATVPDSDTITITDSADPGAMGASGFVRLETPATYFDDLGLATIASMPSSSVARITSAITGPAVDPTTIGGDPGVNVRMAVDQATATNYMNSGAGLNCYIFTEANAKTMPNTSGFATSIADTGGVAQSTSTSTAAAHGNDFTYTAVFTWNAGAATVDRYKQIARFNMNFNWITAINFNTPFQKTVAQRLRATIGYKALRTLP